ncbi:MAG: patatin-like phospholipase family protein [Chitinophagaceae bacterium]
MNNLTITNVKDQVKNHDYLSDDNKKLFADSFDTLSAKQYSDIMDEENNQYVNFVQQGGGVWGIALVGYLYALEIFGIRFLRLAGTSAGAINTLLIAAIGKRNEPKSGKIKDILNDWKLIELVDGRPIVRWLLRNIVYKKASLTITLVLAALIFLTLFFYPFIAILTGWGITFYITALVALACFIIFCVYYLGKFNRHKFGLNPGNDFLEKLKKALADNSVNTIAELDKKYEASEAGLNVKHRFGNDYFSIAKQEIENTYLKSKEQIDESKFKRFKDEINEKFATNPLLLLKSDYTIITTDINNKIKVELPKMASLFWDSAEYTSHSPAEFVKASMSIPIFFEPTIKKINNQDPAIQKAWEQILNIKDPAGITGEAVFIDGGSISNFPIDIFHERDVLWPRLPVFGVRLNDVTPVKKGTALAVLNLPKFFKSLPAYGGQIIDTIRSFNDNSFLMKYSFYNKYAIAEVNCNPSNWLNFEMTETEKKALYNKGFAAGIEFLKRFEWDEYKKDRMVVAFKERGVFKSV